MRTHGDHLHSGHRPALAHWARHRYRSLRRHHCDELTALEELQRDLEEAAADVAARIKRIKDRQEL